MFKNTLLSSLGFSSQTDDKKAVSWGKSKVSAFVVEEPDEEPLFEEEYYSDEDDEFTPELVLVKTGLSTSDDMVLGKSKRSMLSAEDIIYVLTSRIVALKLDGVTLEWLAAFEAIVPTELGSLVDAYESIYARFYRSDGSLTSYWDVFPDWVKSVDHKILPYALPKEPLKSGSDSGTLPSVVDSAPDHEGKVSKESLKSESDSSTLISDVDLAPDREGKVPKESEKRIHLSKKADVSTHKYLVTHADCALIDGLLISTAVQKTSVIGRVPQVRKLKSRFPVVVVKSAISAMASSGSYASPWDE